MKMIIILCVLKGIISTNEFKDVFEVKIKWGLRNLVKNS